MKKKLLIVLITLGISQGGWAQDGYEFGLDWNGSGGGDVYSFTVVAVPNFDSGTYTPILESYGFTLVLPDGITITINDLQPTGTSEIVSTTNGTLVTSIDPSFADKDLVTVVADVGGLTLPAHTAGQVLPLATFTVNGSPTSGLISLLSNTSTLASSPSVAGAFDSYIQADTVDDASTTFTNSYLGQSTVTSFDFNVILGVEEVEIGSYSIYPNPVTDILYFEGPTEDIESIDIISITGQLVNTLNYNFNEIDVSRFENGVYFIRLNEKGTQKILRFIKE